MDFSFKHFHHLILSVFFTDKVLKDWLRSVVLLNPISEMSKILQKSAIHDRTEYVDDLKQPWLWNMIFFCYFSFYLLFLSYFNLEITTAGAAFVNGAVNHVVTSPLLASRLKFMTP